MNAHFSCVTPNSYPVSCRCTCISSDTIPTPSILVINKLFVSVLQKIMCSADPFVIVIIWDLSIIVITPLVSYETTLCNCDYTCPTVVVMYLSFSISFGHHNNFLLILVVTSYLAKIIQSHLYCSKRDREREVILFIQQGVTVSHDVTIGALIMLITVLPYL